MNVFQSCTDTSDVTPLYPSQGLYLKPAARINISVHLPTLKLPGKTISNWEVMEKLRHWASPEEFIVLKVSKSTLEFIRFEGEIENRSKLTAVLARLDGRSIKLSGFPDSLKVRAAEAKPDFPSRHSWDSYFRDAKNMNEMKPGERPDTIHFTNLPCKWFSSKPDGSKPSEHVFRKVFETFGEVRCVDIPMLDPYRNQMKSHISGVKMFSHNQNMIFEAYVQYKEYFCFVKAMDTLRGMKLLYKGPDGRAFSASIKVDFDKTKHLSDSSVRRRRTERDRLMAKEREREERERQAAEQEQAKKEAERRHKQEEKEAKLERRRKREEKRKAKELAKLKQQEAEEMNKKIATEERLLLMAQRRLESIRLLGELFNRIKDTKMKKLKSEDGRNVKLKGKEDSKRNDEVDVMNKEQELRDKLVKKFKTAQEHKVSKQSRKLQRTIEGKNKLRSVLASTSAAALSDTSEDETSSESSLVKSVNAASDVDWKDGKNFKGEGDQDTQLAAYRGRYQRGGRGMHFGGRGHFPPVPYQFPPGGHGANYFGRRRGYRWPRYSSRGRGGGYMQPFIDPVYLDINHQYYKYFHKLAYGDRSRSYSRSSSRSNSRSRSSSYSRSYSRSYTRSRSHSRSRHRHSRSRSTSRRRARSRNSRSRSRSYSKKRSRKHSSSHHRSKSASNSTSKDKQVRKEVTTDSNKNNSLPQGLADQLEPVKSPERFPSIEHTWSRSPSRSRSISWEKRSDDKSDSKKQKHKKSKHKKKKKKRNKDSKD